MEVINKYDMREIELVQRINQTTQEFSSAVTDFSDELQSKQQQIDDF
jgi:hypothetical protein